MKELITNIRIQVNPNIYLKDPESSGLGKRIVTGAIELMVEIGFEQFTFRKLAVHIGSTEASVYRYFESKHMLLLYLTAWYWRWMEYRLVFALANIPSAEERLKRAIHLLTAEVVQDGAYAHINERLLSQVVITDSSKAYLTREVDAQNSLGAFLGYKELVQRVVNVLLELAPDYKYPHMLLSTVIEGAHHQRFFADHLPRLTDVVEGEDAVVQFYTELVCKAIRES